MEAAGLARRVPDPQDRRLVRVALTDQGQSLRERLPAKLDEIAADGLAGLTVEQREELIHLLGQVAVNLNSRKVAAQAARRDRG
jgi:DNA-binding MarR family transcriptional regulator